MDGECGVKVWTMTSPSLERPLAGAEVRNVQAEVGVEDADKGDVREMQALGDHLGADEDIDLVGLEGGQSIAQRVFPAHGIGVDAGELRFRENLGHDFLDLLRAVALEQDVRIAALGAFPRDDGLIAADVADEPLVGAVIGERDGAMRTLANVATGGALERPRKATTVEEEDGLLAFFQPLFERGAELVG